MSDKVTIRNLAQELSLSPSTVHRALTGHLGVSKETRQRVLPAAQQKGYKFPARLRQRNIAVIIPYFSFDGYLECLLPCLEAEFLRRKMQFLLISRQEISLLRNTVFDGIVSLDWKLGLEKILPKKYSVPIMTVGAVSDFHESVSTVMSDPHGIRMALNYLYDRGCRRIFYVTPHEKNSPDTALRLDEFRQFCRETGQNFDTMHQKAPNCMEIVDNMPMILKNKPDAFFVACEAFAARIGQQLKAAGLRIPDDVSLMGLEDRYDNRIFVPPITAIRQDFEQIATAVADNMYQAIVHRIPPRGAVIPFQLIERESVRKEKAG